MGKVRAIQVAEVELLFYSNDHPPPHFHVRKAGEWEIRVYVLTSNRVDGLDYEWVWPRGSTHINGRLIRALLREIEAHRAELLAEWEVKVDY
ncbi:DUF4160 domain-containing protein [Bradymonadaceae bacterium TMQ3]|nr:DUF4160 domain-containing protein [Bradymonadaceae bacterium TMQ3]TXC75499.1 DUF4160 domain-containing protein [Bradymonadales bacterium TMQ1]